LLHLRALLLAVNEVLLAVSARLLAISPLGHRLEISRHGIDRASEFGQLRSDTGDVLSGRHVLPDSIPRNLCGEPNSPRSGQRLRQPGQHHEVSVKPHLRQPAHPERSESVAVLQVAKRTLNGDTAAVESRKR